MIARRWGGPCGPPSDALIVTALFKAIPTHRAWRSQRRSDFRRRLAWAGKVLASKSKRPPAETLCGRRAAITPPMTKLETMNRIVRLDDFRPPHPRRAQRLKAMPSLIPADLPAVQAHLRRCHGDPALRAQILAILKAQVA